MSGYDKAAAGEWVEFEEEGTRDWRLARTQDSAITLRRFAADDSPVRGIMGPVGSGKTTKALLEGIMRAARQEPGPDGVARAKFLVIRRTYRDLWRSTIGSWVEWVPRTQGQWTGGKDQPAEHRLTFQAGERIIKLTVQFVAIGDGAAEDALRGYEATYAFLDEADLLPPDVIGYLLKRLGRYPKKDSARGFNGATWRGLWMCFNAPNHDNWLYQKFFENRPESWALFVQPGGREARAENVENLPDGYYETDGMEDWEVQRLIDNKPGYSRDGQPVMTEYSDALHCGDREIEPVKGHDLILGVDAGRTPACVVLQRHGRKLLVLREYCAVDIDAKSFGAMVADHLARDFPGFTTRIAGWAIPPP